MHTNFVDADTADFDAQTYLRILVAIAKSDKENGPPEYDYVRRQAQSLGLDFDHFIATTDKSFSIGLQKVSRLTALVILHDAIALASMDRNFSLPERQRVYGYAEKLDISRTDVDALEELVQQYRQLNQRWETLVEKR